MFDTQMGIRRRKSLITNDSEAVFSKSVVIIFLVILALFSIYLQIFVDRTKIGRDDNHHVHSIRQSSVVQWHRA